jgi:hypothetical protein
VFAAGGGPKRDGATETKEEAPKKPAAKGSDPNNPFDL